MSVDLQILGSGSAGNCALLRTGDLKILIDAGFSARRIGRLLKEVDECIGGVDAVFLTHEHSDHTQGLRGLTQFPDLPVFANRDTAESIQARLTKSVNWQIFQTGADFKFRNIRIHPFALPHDAYDPVGFTFFWSHPDGSDSSPRSLAWVTDLGYVPEHVRQHLRKVRTLVIEANYDEKLLEKDERRPWSLKQRIRSRHGHLSNDAAFELIGDLSRTGPLEKVYLAHLSKDCNSVDLVRKRFASLEERLSVHVVDPECRTVPVLRAVSRDVSV